MAPQWFELVAWASLALGFACALAIAADIVLFGHRQHMAIMNMAFPLTALYMGPVALWAYLPRGRRMGTMEGESRTSWWQVSVSDSHCGPAAPSVTSAASGSSGLPAR
jgi:hypothetical protein